MRAIFLGMSASYEFRDGSCFEEMGSTSEVMRMREVQMRGVPLALSCLWEQLDVLES